MKKIIILFLFLNLLASAKSFKSTPRPRTTPRVTRVRPTSSSRSTSNRTTIINNNNNNNYHNGGGGGLGLVDYLIMDSIVNRPTRVIQTNEVIEGPAVVTTHSRGDNVFFFIIALLLVVLIFAI